MSRKCPLKGPKKITKCGAQEGESKTINSY